MKRINPAAFIFPGMIAVAVVVVLVIAAPKLLRLSYDPSYVQSIRDTFNPPSKTVTSFFNLVCDGDFGTDEQNFSASIPLHKDVLRLGMGSFLKECKENGGLYDVQVTNSSVAGEIATVSGTQLFKNQQRSPFNMKLYLKQGSWKIAWNQEVFERNLEKLAEDPRF